MDEIRDDLDSRISYFERKRRHDRRPAHRGADDLRPEMMQETGYCSGIENYSVYLSDRESGEAPYTLLDYFPDDFLTVVDESHVTLPQIRGQFAGDKSGKDFAGRERLPAADGLRQPAAHLRGIRGEDRSDPYVSATPSDYEREGERADRRTDRSAHPSRRPGDRGF